MGVTIALPLLDAMWPAMTALAQSPARPRTRFGAVYFPNGAIMEEWIPAEVGSGFTFKTILKPLEPFKDQLVVVSNLTRSHPGSQVGDHAVIRLWRSRLARTRRCRRWRSRQKTSPDMSAAAHQGSIARI
jgi:hypothetical protein